MFNYLQELSQRQYCERIKVTSEPLNTFSNLGFFISAFLCYELIQKSRIRNSNIKKLPLLILIIGVGSTLWHASPSPITLLADFIPIWIFVFFSIYILLAKLVSDKKIIFLYLSIFFAAQVLITIFVPENFLNGSNRYILVLFVGILSMMKIYKESPSLAFNMFLPISIFALGITVRTLDHSLCNLIPIGTHFIWHLTVALATYLMVRFLVKAEQIMKTEGTVP